MTKMNESILVVTATAIGKEGDYGNGRSWKVMEGHGRLWKVMEGYGRNDKMMKMNVK
jgi:hypothetical protein